MSGAIESVENPHEMLIRLIIGLALILIVLIFRKKIAQCFVFVFGKLFIRKSEMGRKALKDSLVTPLSFFLLVVSIWGGTEIIAPSGEVRSPILLIVKIGLIVSSGWFGIRLINSDYSFVLSDSSSQSKKTAVKFISNIFKGAIIIFSALLVLEQFGVSATKIFAALGLGGVAIAFACKDAVENMLSGFIIIFDRPFEVDDTIEIEGVTGTVEDIKIRTTRIRAVDGSERIYPNTKMANTPLANWTKISKRAVNSEFGLTYNMSREQLEKFSAELEKILRAHSEVIDESVRISFDEYGESALIVKAFYYIREADIIKYKRVLTDINLSVKEFIDSSDIEMAFSTQTVHLINEKTATD